MEVNLSKQHVQIICEALELLAQKKRDDIDVYHEAFDAIAPDVTESIDRHAEDAIRDLEVSAIEIDELAVRLLNQIKE